jgi:RNA polymerase sigma factor (sigma-70 family)
MNDRTEAETYLLAEIRGGSGDAWSQLVERYQGRLTAFARRRIPKGTEAEDLVQDTFLNFLRGLSSYREQASIETYLFVILRRRIAELHRGPLARACAAPDDTVQPNHPAPDPTASWYARQNETRDAAREALAAALRSLLHGMRENLELHDMQIVELVFYAQWPNRRIAEELNEDAGHIAVLKHRWLIQLRDRVVQILEKRAREPEIPWDAPDALDSLLTEIWETQRPSCPKRSTVGGFVLQTLDAPWQAYIDFHINRLGCPFCRANMEDLLQQNRHDPAPLRQRIMQSTVGFFSASAQKKL